MRPPLMRLFSVKNCDEKQTNDVLLLIVWMIDLVNLTLTYGFLRLIEEYIISLDPPPRPPLPHRPGWAKGHGLRLYRLSLYGSETGGGESNEIKYSSYIREKSYIEKIIHIQTDS